MQKSKLILIILYLQKKILALYNVFNKGQNHYYPNIYLEKCSYK